MGAHKFVLHAFVMSAYFYSTWGRDSHGYPASRWPMGKVEEAEWALGHPVMEADVRLPLPQAWRRRWFVLRRGRLSGDRDVLEYYRSQRASKPIRAIDLSECAVWKHTGPGFVRKEFQNHFVFIVKTTSRTFYLVAKTEEEMQVWVHSISQVCNLSHLEDSTGKSQLGVGGGGAEAKVLAPSVPGGGGTGWPSPGTARRA